MQRYCGMRLRPIRAFYLTVTLTVAATLHAADPILYSRDVLPILKQSCYGCHGIDEPMANLDLRTRAGMLKGGAHGPAVAPKDPSESLMYLHISGSAAPMMPMGGALTDDEIMTIRYWIEEGAKFDIEEGQDEKQAHGQKADEGSTGISEEDRNWWAFKQPVRKPTPQVEDVRWADHPVDAFLYRKLAAKGLRPAGPTDGRTLVRRAYLDLTGLLPSPEEVAAFLNDRSPDAYAKLIDKLLASQHYGERWGRHWLDVVRYADSHGYEHDYDFPNAWRYRDYVIRSFNGDKPYNRFLLEQLAGDELDEVSHDSLIATGFYRVAPRVGFREKDNPQYRYIYLDDLIATTSRGIMGLSVDCARCHDHKFDPIPQIDYYRMMAVFFPYVKYDYPLAPAHEVAAYEEKKAAVEARTKPLKQSIAEIQEPYQDVAFEKKLATFPEDIQTAVRTPEADRAAGQQLLAEQVLAIKPGGVNDLLSPQDAQQVKGIKEQIEKFENELPPPLPMAMGVRDGDYRFAPNGLGDEVLPGKGEREFYDFEGTFLPQAGKPFNFPVAHMLPTGDYRNKGPAVEPGFMHVLSTPGSFRPQPPADGPVTTGYRRALAEWLISKDHPLTARVIVNRIWAHHFGTGLVRTAGNFGRMGEQPSHPELLDWLTLEFCENGWSIKQMHRLIMTSAAYRMSSVADDPGAADGDPENRYLSRYPQRRLEAEGVRDIILVASGKLNRQFGGEPFFPPLPESVWKSSGKGKWILTEEGPDVWRRSVYSYWKRGLKHPMLEVFDQPNPNVTCERRNTTTVPTQALTLLNNEFVLLHARHFAERVIEDVGTDREAQVRRAYQIALARNPGSSELARNIAFLDQQATYHAGRDSEQSTNQAALTDLCDVILNLNEFVYIN